MRAIRRITVSVATIAITINASWGCGASAPAVAPHPQAMAVPDRIAGIRLAAAKNDRSSIPPLVDRLDDEDLAVRWAAIVALEDLTGHRFGYRSASSIEDRASATARWRRFLRRNRTATVPASAGRRIDENATRPSDSEPES